MVNVYGPNDFEHKGKLVMAHGSNGTTAIAFQSRRDAKAAAWVLREMANTFLVDANLDGIRWALSLHAIHIGAADA